MTTAMIAETAAFSRPTGSKPGTGYQAIQGVAKKYSMNPAGF